MCVLVGGGRAVNRKHHTSPQGDVCTKSISELKYLDQCVYHKKCLILMM